MAGILRSSEYISCRISSHLFNTLTELWLPFWMSKNGIKTKMAYKIFFDENYIGVFNFINLY